MIRGKHGNLIGKVYGEKQVFTRLYWSTNPQTTEQQKHRMKLAFVNRLSKVLEEAVNRGFALVPKSGSGQTARNAFVHENFYNGAIVWDEETGE